MMWGYGCGCECEIEWPNSVRIGNITETGENGNNYKCIWWICLSYWVNLQCIDIYLAIFIYGHSGTHIATHLLGAVHVDVFSNASHNKRMIHTVFISNGL